MCIKLVYITDKNYVMPTMASITSAIKNQISSYKVYVITTFEDTGLFEKFHSMENCNTEIIIIPIDINDYIAQNINTINHVPTTALIKFYLPYILSMEDKILYIDGDTVVQKPLDELYNTGLDNNYAGVVFDSALVFLPQNAEFLQIETEKYFNTGVMLLNLKKMRNDRIPDKLLNYKLTQFNYFMDQDSFNKIMYNNVVYLPDKFNMMYLSKNLGKKLKPYVKEKSLKQRLRNAVIIHFALSPKPWISNHPNWCAASRIFQKYYKLSPCGKVKQKLKHNNFMIKFIKIAIKQYL